MIDKGPVILFTMADKPILIVMDSRGRDIDYYIDKAFVHLDAHI